MPLVLTDAQLKNHIENHQQTFNLMVKFANELANTWLQSGFHPNETDHPPFYS